MATSDQIKASSRKTDAFLRAKQRQHVSMVQESIRTLQKDITNSLNLLSVTDSGKIESLKVNLKQAQKLHIKIEEFYYKDFNNYTRKMIRDFKSVASGVLDNLKGVGEAAKFTSIDETMMKTLRDGYYADYLAISESSKNKVVQAMYNQVIGGGDFSSLVETIRTSLTGGGIGVSLAQYSTLYARDMIMNFHNEVMLKKADDLGMDTFIYTGTIMGKTRRFCRRRVGNPYTRKEIESWKYKWQGKSGPAMTHRGGFNCRHHWQPVRKEWLTDAEAGMMDKLWKLDKKGKPIKKKPIPKKPAKKPVKKPVPKEIGKDIIKPPQEVPTLKDVQRDVIRMKQGGEYKKLWNENEAFQKTIEGLEKSQAGHLKIIHEMNDQYGYFTARGMTKYTKAYEAHLELSKKIAKEQSASRELVNKMKDMENKVILDRIRPPKGGIIKWVPSGRMSKVMENKITKNFEETADLLHPDVLASLPVHQIRYQSGIRAYYNQGISTSYGVKRKPTLHLGSGDKITQTHEFGHGIEYYRPGLQKKARDFLAERAAGAKPTTIYKGTSEKGWRDGFFNHYVGKYYQHGATEIISMGLQQMHESPMAFLNFDPGHFEFILKIMWGVI